MGRVKRIETGPRSCPTSAGTACTFQNDGPTLPWDWRTARWVYFVHSYCGVAASGGGRDCPHGVRRVGGGSGAAAAMCTAASSTRRRAVKIGLQILKNFGELNR